jgi:hypothetical protein
MRSLIMRSLMGTAPLPTALPTAPRQLPSRGPSSHTGSCSSRGAARRAAPHGRQLLQARVRVVRPMQAERAAGAARATLAPVRPTRLGERVTAARALVRAPTAPPLQLTSPRTSIAQRRMGGLWTCGRHCSTLLGAPPPTVRQAVTNSPSRVQAALTLGTPTVCDWGTGTSGRHRMDDDHSSDRRHVPADQMAMLVSTCPWLTQWSARPPTPSSAALFSLTSPGTDKYT